MNNKRIKDGIIGLTVGDALGVPYEFTKIETMQQSPCTDMIGYGTWNRPRGSWSDDTSMTLATIGGLIRHKGKINYESIMREFIRWIVNGDYTQDGDVFDFGITTEDALNNYLN